MRASRPAWSRSDPRHLGLWRLPSTSYRGAKASGVLKNGVNCGIRCFVRTLS